MKKRLLKILMLLFLIGNLTFSEYVVKDGKVFYDGKEVLRADIGSFRILNNKIAVDSQNIYFLGSRTIKSEKMLMIHQNLFTNFQVIQEN